jgi:hypothetical protein
MVNKKINHDAGCEMQDAGCESVQKPMNTGCSARGTEGAERDGEVQRSGAMVDPVRNVEDLRLKTRFFQNDGTDETRIDTNFYVGSQGVANDQGRCERCPCERDIEGRKRGSADKSVFLRILPYIFLGGKKFQATLNSKDSFLKIEWQMATDGEAPSVQHPSSNELPNFKLQPGKFAAYCAFLEIFSLACREATAPGGQFNVYNISPSPKPWRTGQGWE